MKTIKAIVAAILTVCLLSACTSTTVLKTNNPKAKIYADGKYIGEGQASYSDKKVVGSRTVIELKAEGHQDYVTTISRSGQVNPGALVGGILLAPTFFGLLFFLWVMDYNDYYSFEVQPEVNPKSTR
jgi:hypothetical protein